MHNVLQNGKPNGMLRRMVDRVLQVVVGVLLTTSLIVSAIPFIRVAFGV